MRAANAVNAANADRRLLNLNAHHQPLFQAAHVHPFVPSHAASAGARHAAQSPVRPRPYHLPSGQTIYLGDGGAVFGAPPMDRAVEVEERSGLLRGGVVTDIESRAWRDDPLECLECNRRKGSRLAGCLVVLIFLAFVALMCALIVVVIVRVDGVLHTLDMQPLRLKMHATMDVAHNASHNFHVLSDELRTTLHEMQPGLEGAVNSTYEMVTNVRSFAHHPAMTFTAAPIFASSASTPSPSSGKVS